MRRDARVDGNHKAVVNQFRKCGCAVLSLAPMGHGVPDLLCSVKPRFREPVSFLVEVKNGALPPSRRQLTQQEAEFHRSWPGLIYVVEAVEEVPGIVIAVCRGAVEE